MLNLWRYSQKLRLKTPQDAIVALGLFMGLCYFPSWFRFLLYQMFGYASGSCTLAICLVAISGVVIRRTYHQLAALQPLDADIWTGNALVVIGIIIFPFCRATLWLQAVCWLLILVGVAMGQWGMTFFRRYPGLVVSVTLSVYPNPGHILKTLCQMLMPSQSLEIWMAGLTTDALSVMGYHVSASGDLIQFTDHHVKVGWACNGLDMALAMIGISLLLGYCLRLSKRQILLLCGVGAILALLINIPRLMLMSLAAVYWGSDVFDFWHGSWGGQLFVALLLMGYYACFARQLRTRSLGDKGLQ